MLLAKLSRSLARDRTNRDLDDLRRLRPIFATKKWCRGIHRRLPHGHRQVATESTGVNRLAIAHQKSRPNAAGDPLIIAQEPRIGEVMRGAAFARAIEGLLDHPVQNPFRAATKERSRHHAVDLPRCGRIDDAPRRFRGAWTSIDHPTLRIFDPIQINQRVRRRHPFQRKGRHRPYGLLHRDFLESDGQPRQQLGFTQRQTKSDTGIDDLLESHLPGKTHGGGDFRILQRDAWSHLALVDWRCDFHSPFAKNPLAPADHHRTVIHRLILHQRGGRLIAA